MVSKDAVTLKGICLFCYECYQLGFYQGIIDIVCARRYVVIVTGLRFFSRFFFCCLFRVMK